METKAQASAEMILINLAGGPGTGKSTSAAHLFAELKMEGVKAELVGEEAKDIVYDQCYPLFNNQVLICGKQWQRILRLQRAGCEVAISDSPLIQGMMYVQDSPFYEELFALVRKLETLVPQTRNVWLNRVKPYTTFGRMQTEEQARELDIKAKALVGKFWLEVDGNRHGVHHLAEEILPLVKRNREIANPDSVWRDVEPPYDRRHHLV